MSFENGIFLFIGFLLGCIVQWVFQNRKKLLKSGIVFWSPPIRFPFIRFYLKGESPPEKNNKRLLPLPHAGGRPLEGKYLWAYKELAVKKGLNNSDDWQSYLEKYPEEDDPLSAYSRSLGACLGCLEGRA